MSGGFLIDVCWGFLIQKSRKMKNKNEKNQPNSKIYYSKKTNKDVSLIIEKIKTKKN